VATRIKNQERQPPATSQPGIVPPYLAERAKEAQKILRERAAKNAAKKKRRRKT